VCDHEYEYCPVRFGLLPNTPHSGKIAVTRPLALLCCFAYTQDAKDRLPLQGFPPFSPVSGAVPNTWLCKEYEGFPLGLCRIRVSTVGDRSSRGHVSLSIVSSGILRAACQWRRSARSMT